MLEFGPMQMCIYLKYECAPMSTKLSNLMSTKILLYGKAVPVDVKYHQSLTKIFVRKCAFVSWAWHKL